MSHKKLPETKDEFLFFHDITTRWMDNDAYGHVNNVIYYSWFDTAIGVFLMERAGLSIESSDVVGLVVETQCRYARSVAFPDRITVGVRVTKIGRSSVRYELGIFRNDEIEASAEGHFVHVYVDRASNRPVAQLPDNYLRAVEGIHRPSQVG